MRWGIIFVGGMLLFVSGLYFTYGDPFADVPRSTVVFDADGGLLGARVAADGQWRFDPADSLPGKYIACVLEFEDRYFYAHPGVNPLALMRALIQNMRAGEIVSGGSTVSMQVIRLSRGTQPRNVWQKSIEMLLALQLELRNSKSDILKLYASQAPMGGNVVGLEAASWRYFGRPPNELSWGEAATLAVLPNAPALIHPGRNRETLQRKRDRLLISLLSRGRIDSSTFELACSESLPEAPLALPERASHFVDYQRKNGRHRVESTLVPWIQDRSYEIIARQQKKLAANHIHNLAVLVLDNSSGQVVAYHGNGLDDGMGLHAHQVDLIRSERSSGSILKPLLYAGMLDAGEILPGTLVPDIPTRYADFSPDNFNHAFDGAVPADEALIRSLNVPAVRMLKEYGVLRLVNLLKDLGINSLHRSADHYGLSLILGGAEVRLWEVCQVYSGLARSLKQSEKGVLSRAAVYLTLEAMKKVKRPESEAGWAQFLSARDFAWKTGTSFGFRDAWAIGVNTDYTIGVWVGNADGEGRPGLTGSAVAAPVLFEVAGLLPDAAGWFAPPLEEMRQVVVCRESGMLASANCVQTDTLLVPLRETRTGVCPYHIRISLNQTGSYRVHGACYPVRDIQFRSWFVLPPAMAWYYASRHPQYQPLPAWQPGCLAVETDPIEIIYPHPGEKIFLPNNASGERERLWVEIVHQSPEAKLFWFLDGQFLGTTETLHQMELPPEAGLHELHVSDSDGRSATRRFSLSLPVE